MRNYLLVDFGSTNTKLTAVDVENAKILGTAKANTTVATDINEGYLNALQDLEKITGPQQYIKKIACSSAAGGLKMAAIGLVEELTVEAAKRACYGAGAKVDLVFSFYLNNEDIALIKERKIDIILLAGGTDGGNREVIVANAQKLAENKIDIPIIYGGNKAARDEVKTIFQQYQLDAYFVSNIMPKLNELQIEEAQAIIRQIFLKNIIVAKGIKHIETLIDEVIFPTPGAVLKAAQLLSQGYLDEAGLGDIVLFDIGGATTDVYSIASGEPSRADIIFKGLAEPFNKRTVEGDLGMRYSALGIVNPLSEETLKRYQEKGLDLIKEAKYRAHHIDFIPTTDEDKLIDRLFGGLAVDHAFSRHVGKIESVYTPLGMMYYQTGKDLSNVRSIIGTGGVVINDENPTEILAKALYMSDKPLELRPKNANYLLDKSYILSAMGLLSLEAPEVALKIMKENIIKI